MVAAHPKAENWVQRTGDGAREAHRESGRVARAVGVGGRGLDSTCVHDTQGQRPGRVGGDAFRQCHAPRAGDGTLEPAPPFKRRAKPRPNSAWSAGAPPSCGIVLAESASRIVRVIASPVGVTSHTSELMYIHQSLTASLTRDEARRRTGRWSARSQRDTGAKKGIDDSPDKNKTTVGNCTQACHVRGALCPKPGQQLRTTAGHTCPSTLGVPCGGAKVAAKAAAALWRGRAVVGDDAAARAPMAAYRSGTASRPSEKEKGERGFVGLC